MEMARPSGRGFCNALLACDLTPGALASPPKQEAPGRGAAQARSSNHGRRVKSQA